MALLWTLAEGIILYFIIWGNHLIKGTNLYYDKKRKIFWAIFIILGVLLFLGEKAFGDILSLNEKINLHLYRWLLWNFFCTLWVIMEGLIMIYGLKIFKGLKIIINRKESHKILNQTLNNQKGIRKILFNPSSILISFMVILFVLYHFSLVSMAKKALIDLSGIFNLSRFYVRICGIFWIIFEWIIAYVCIRSFKLLKTLKQDSK